MCGDVASGPKPASCTAKNFERMTVIRNTETALDVLGNNHLFLADEPAHRGFFDAVAAFIGDPPIKGPLPGTKSRKERLEGAVANVEKNWMIKIIVIVAAIAGVVISGLELWRLMRP